MPQPPAARAESRAFLLALLGLTALRLAMAAAAPVSPDEAYYWVWSRAPAWSYYDHSFMVAVWVRIGTWFFGPTPLGLRLLGPLSAFGASLLILDAARRLGAGRGYAAALLLNATLLLGAGSILMTPDTPLLFFWTLTLWAMARLAAGGSGWWWLAAGAAAGLALDSKYTGALLLVGVGLWCLLLPAARRHLRDPRAWAGLALALLLFLPVILWNADHAWVSFIKQGGRTGNFQPSRALQFLGELIGGQAGLATPIIFALCACGLWVETRRVIRTRDPVAGLLVAFGLLPALVFVQHALGARVQGNWPEILYPAAVIAAARLSACRRWLAPSLALGFALTLLVYVQALGSPIPMGGASDPTIRLLGGWPRLTQAVAARAETEGARFVAVDEYGLGSELALRLPQNLPVISDEPRWLVFNLPHPETRLPPGTPGLFIRTTRRQSPPDTAAWSQMTRLGTLDRGRGRRVGERYEIFAVTIGPDAPPLLTRLPSGAVP